MAVKKKQTKAEEKVEDINVVDTVEVNEVDVNTEEIPEEIKDSVNVVEEYFTVDEEQIPEEKYKNVRVRARVDHKCTIAMVKYELKKGQCYNVPENVKRILDKAGLLAPL